MAETAGTFSESWYRIADQHAALRPHVHVRRQYYRGERWHVLHDPINNQFFRLRPAAYEFVARLRMDRTIEQVWEECLAVHPNDAPGQEDIIRLLAQLYSANLLYSDLPADSAKLFERFKQRRQREVTSRLTNIMFARFPLFDPDELLKRCMPVAKLLISPFGALLWLVAVGYAIKLGIDNAGSLMEQSQGILAPDNLFLFYIGFIITKTIHEFGHAFVCRRLGGEVHTMGIMLMIFTPIPYVDTTSSWSFRNRWKRIFVGSAGMIAELFLAAIAMFVWANTGEGTVHSLAYNMIFLASVTTLLFNLNPLMRFDGYYILSDLLDIPNLQMRANKQLGHLIERYAFGCKKSESPTDSRREAWWLAVFGVSSHVYRVLIFAGILLFLADRFLILGIIMTIICLISWIILPIGKLLRYLASSPRLERNRPRAIAVCAGTFAALLILLEVIPFPNHFRAPGVLQAVEHTVIASETPGYIDKILAASNSDVVRGQPLVQLRDRDLEFDLAAMRAQHNETKAMELRALQERTADLQPIRSRLESISKRLRHLEEQQERLTVRAKHDGRWIAPDLEDLFGAWLSRGSPLGLLVNSNAFHFSAVVSQKEASRLFAQEIRGAEVRLWGQSGTALPVSVAKIIQAEHVVLPSPALGWAGGGEVPIRLDDPDGIRAAEPFFELRAAIEAARDTAVLHGRSGKIRFDLPAEPLLHQWIRKLRQLIQTRYSV